MVHKVFLETVEKSSRHTFNAGVCTCTMLQEIKYHTATRDVSLIIAPRLDTTLWQVRSRYEVFPRVSRFTPFGGTAPRFNTHVINSSRSERFGVNVAKPSKARRRLAKIHISAHNTEGMTDQVELEQAKPGGEKL